MLRNNIRMLNEIIFQNNSKNYSAAASFIVIVIAVMTIAGWQLNIEVLRRPISGLVAMNPMTAVSTLLASISLLLILRFSSSRQAMFVSRLLAAGVLTVGLLKIGSIVFGIEAGVDTWIFADKLNEEASRNLTNRMAPNAAMNLIFCSLALLLARSHRVKLIYLSNSLVLIAASISLLSIIGYTYGAHSFSEIHPYIPMAFHTALSFVLLSIAILCAETDRGIMTVIGGSYRGNQIIQLLLPIAIVIPILFGLLRLYGERNGIFNNSYGTALFATANIAIFVFLIFKTASSLNRSDRALLQEMEERKKIEKELRESNVFLDTIFQYVPNMIFVKDAHNLKFVQINKGGEKLLELSRKDIIGKNDHDIFPKHQAESITTMDRQLIEKRELLDIPEESWSTKRGERWLHTKKIPVFDEENNPQYIIGIAEDITELKIQNDRLQEFYRDLELKVQERTEQILRTEHRFKALLEKGSDAICLTNHQGVIHYQSPSVERMTGYSENDWASRRLIDIIHPTDHTRVQRLLVQLLANAGASESILCRLLHKQKYYIWIEGSITNLLEDENVRAIVYNFRNTTEKKLAEEAVAMSEEKYRLLFSSNPLPAWVFDTETLKFLEVNDAAVDAYGYTRDEFHNMTIRDIRPLEDVTELLLQRTVSDNSINVIYNGYWRHRKKDGEIVFVDITSRHINFKGRTGRLVIAHDITDKVEAERKLNEANAILQVRAKELAASNKELEQFAYVASHDLQEPLRMVSSFLQLLEKRYKDLLDETGKQYIHFAVDGAERMKKLILDLLAYSRTGTSKEISTTVDMNAIAKEVATTFEFTLKETGGEIILHDLPKIVAVKSQMQQLIQNLVSNALKYRGSEPPRVEISASDNETLWEFRVADNGIGVDKRFFEKIFVIFQRLHNKTEYSGTGIGLAICKKIVERHGGSIAIESELGSGSTFTFSIKKPVNNEHV